MSQKEASISTMSSVLPQAGVDNKAEEETVRDQLGSKNEICAQLYENLDEVSAEMTRATFVCRIWALVFLVYQFHRTTDRRIDSIDG